MRQFRLGIIILVALSLLLALSFVTIQISRTSTGQNPVASFTYSPDMPTPTETITFDASSSSSPNGAIVSYAWDFGDGYTAVLTSPITTHSYPLDGNYTVQLIVTDNVGLTAATSAVVQVNCVQFFRVTEPDMLTPVANVVVTVYTNETGTWAKAPVSGHDFEIKYDNMTQPKLASTGAQKYRNPGYTASILLRNASDIGFDSHSGSYYVYFTFSVGVMTAKWPNSTSLVYTYKNGQIETHNYLSGHGAVWDAAAGTYVIKVGNIAGQGVAPTQDHPIIVPLPFPQNLQQYYLTVKTDPSGIVSIPGQGVYSNGTSTSLAAPSYVNISSSARYRFNNWDVDGTSQGSTNPITVSMNANHTATAHYVLQYLVTFGQTGLLTGATGTVVTINAVAQGYSSLPYTMWLDNGASVTYSYNSIVASSVSGQQFRLSSISGLTSPLTVTSAVTVTGTYVTQYLITFAQTGLDSTATGTVVTVNGNAKVYSNLSYGLWVDCSSSVTYSYGSIVSSSVSGKQFRLSSVTGSSSPITVAGPATITGNYITQYLVTFAQTGLDSTASGTVVTANSNAKVYSTLPYAFWVDTGTSVTYSYGSIVSSSVSGKQFRLSSVTGSSSPITVTATQAITGNYVVQFQLTFSQTGLDSTATGTVLTVNSNSKAYGDFTYMMWADSGSSVTYSFSSIVTSSVSGKQFKLNTFSGLSSPFTVTAPSSMAGNYKTQYYLTVSSVYGSPSPVSGWFDSGSSITESVSSPVSGGSGVQYVCTGWTGTGSVPVSGSGSSVTFTINAASAVTWGWKTQFYLTVSSVYGSPSPVSGWFDSGSSITDSVTSPVSGGSGVRYVCMGWTGTGSIPASGASSSVTFTINAASTIVWNWKSQYQITFDQTGVGSDYNGTVVTVDSVTYGVSGLSVSFWFDSGSGHSFSFASALVVGSKQYAWSSTSGLSTLESGTLTVTTSGSVVGNYIIQNQVTFDQVGVSSDFTGTVVTVDSVNYSISELPVSFSWTVGSMHSFTFQSPLLVSANSKQYVWTSTTGLSSSQSGSITVSSYGSIIGNYKIQYYFTVTSLYGSPSPVSGWFDSGSGITESVSSPVSGGSGVQYVCTGWTGTGSVPVSGSGSSVTFTINAASAVTWGWKTQFYLTVSSVYGSPSPVSGWFDSGSGITESVSSPVSGGSGVQYVCTGWTGTGSVPVSGSGSSVTFTINAASAVTWGWKTQFYLTVSSVYGSPSPVSGWFDSGSGITESVSSPVSGGSGVQYVCTGWAGSGSVPSSGGSSSVTFTIGSPSNIVWGWKTQYAVTFGYGGLDSSASGTIAIVNGVPLNFGQLPYTIWVDNGGLVTYSYGNVSSSNSGEQFNLLGVSGLPSPATVTGTMTMTGNYVVQYQVTFGQTGVGSDFVGTVLTVDSNTYSVSSLPVSFWFDSGSSHSYSFASLLPVNASLQYSWSSTSGLVISQSGSLFVSGSGSVSGNYVSQIAYQITFDPGVGPDWVGPVVTIDGVNYTEAELPVSFMWNVSSVHTFAFLSPLVVTANVKQYVWDYTTGLSTAQSGSITVTSNGTIAGYYKTQYYLTLATDPVSVNSPVGAGWYDSGSVASISTDAFVVITPGSARYRFNGWSTTNMTEISDATRSPTNVSMDAGMTVTAEYVAQYNVSFDASGVGSDFTGTVVTVDLVNFNGSQLPLSLWLDSGSSHGFAYQSPLVVTPNGEQYVWTGTAGMDTMQSDTLTVSASGSIVGSYGTQYYLTVTASPGSVASPLGSGWYGPSIPVTITAPTVSGYNFNGWYVDGVALGGGASAIVVTMGAAHTATAYYQAVPQPNQTVGGTSFSLAKPAPLSYFGVYSIMIASGAVVLSLKRRRRK